MSEGPKVVTMEGKPVDKPVPAVTPLSVLKDLVAQIERGDVVLEHVYIIGHVASDDDMYTQPNWDDGLTLGEVVYMLDSHKIELIRLAQREK